MRLAASDRERRGRMHDGEERSEDRYQLSAEERQYQEEERNYMREELRDRKRKRDRKPEYLQYKRYIYVVILLIVALLSFFPIAKMASDPARAYSGFDSLLGGDHADPRGCRDASGG